MEIKSSIWADLEAIGVKNPECTIMPDGSVTLGDNVSRETKTAIQDAIKNRMALGLPMVEYAT